MSRAFLLGWVLLCSVLPAGAAQFWSQGKSYPLPPLSTRWIGVEVAPGSTLEAAGTAMRRRTRNVLSGQPAKRSVSKRVLLFETRAGIAAASVHTARQQAWRVAGVHRVLRVYGDSASPIVETAELVVQFASAIQPSQVTTLLGRVGARSVRSLGVMVPNGYVAQVTDPRASALDAANRLHAMPQVRFAHPSLLWPLVPRYTPNDPLFTQQWHLQNTGQSGGTPGADIKAPAAWDIQRGNASTIIAVIDDGVDLLQEDLHANLVAGYDFRDHDSNPSPAAGDDHGTAVAGVAAAVGSNGLGVTGVAPACKIMPIRLIGGLISDTDIADAFRYAADHGAGVINNSWGPPDGRTTLYPLPDVVKAGIDYAINTGRGGKGCIVVFAAGNGNESVMTDGYSSYSRVLAIAASTNQDVHASYSDYGAAIALCAPSNGGSLSITTTDRTGTAGYSTGNYTPDFGGTSSAAPVVSGVAALLMAQDPGATADQIKQRLIAGADKISPATGAYDSQGHSIYFGFGRVNARRSLERTPNVPAVTMVLPNNNALIGAKYTLRATDSNNALVQSMTFQGRLEQGSFLRTPNLFIPDVSTVADSTSFTPSFTIENAQVTVNINHSCSGDLKVDLIAPDNSSWNVFTGDVNCFPVVAVNMAVPGLAGKNAHGTWKLQVTDRAALDTGTLVNWGVSFYSNWKTLAQVTTPDANGAWSSMWSASGQSGKWTVKAVAATTLGAFEDQHTNISRDDLYPTATVTVPAANAAFVSSPLARGTAGDTGPAGLASVKINLWRPAVGATPAGYWAGGTTWTTTYSATVNEVPVTGTTSWSLQLPALTTSQYKIRAVARDRANNTTYTAFVPFWIDTVVPAVFISSPKTNSIQPVAFTTSGTASDNVGLKQITIQIYRPATATTSAAWWAGGTSFTSSYSVALNERPCTGTTSWTLSIPQLPQALYRLQARAVDLAGNIGNSTSVSFAADQSNPLVTITNLANGQTYQSVTQVTGTASDANGITKVTVRFYRQATATTTAGYWAGGSTWTAQYSAANELPATGTTSWSFALPSLPPGGYIVAATATDGAGRKATSAFISFTIS